METGRRKMRVTRKIIEIDEERCDGCGQCVPSCAEGAIEVVDGKARLVADKFCESGVPSAAASQLSPQSSTPVEL